MTGLRRWWMTGVAILVSIGLAGGALAQNVCGSRPKIGLALSGGGAKGVAHVGVLMVLEEMGVPIDFIAGTSMGSIIGGLYAAGYTSEQLADLVKHTDWQFAFDPEPYRRLLRYDQKNERLKFLFEVGIKQGSVELPSGAIPGYKLTSLLTSLCLQVDDIHDFDRLPIPFRTVATDILNGDKVVLSQGRLALAMRASMSIPSVFPPFELDGRLLVDGGVVENLPVETVKAMGADVVIAVNVSSPLKNREQLKDLLDILDQTISLQIDKSTKAQLELADLVITPKVQEFGTFSFDQSDKLIQLGREAAEKSRTELQALLTSLGHQPRPYQRPDVQLVETILVDQVVFEGSSRYDSEFERLAPFEPGETVTPKQLDETVQKIYGLGVFKDVRYEVEPQDNGRSKVAFIVEEKPGTALSRLGLSIGFSTDRIDEGQLRLNIVRPDTFFAGSYGELNLYLGRSSGLNLGLKVNNQPFDGLFFHPQVFFDSTIHNIFDNQEILADYVQTQYGAWLQAGFYLGTAGEFTLGYKVKDDKSKLRIATGPHDEVNYTLAGPTASLRLDTLDRKPFPTKGLTSTIEAFWSEEELGSERDYTQLLWEGGLVFTLGRRHTFEPNWTLATALNTDVPDSQYFFIGGHDGLWGYAFEEFAGSDLARFQLLYRYQWTDNLFLQAAANGASVWPSWDEMFQEKNDWAWGGGAGIAWRTPIGPFEATLGLGEQGRTHVYIQYGYGF